MNFLAVNICCCAVLFLLVNRGEALRCRSGNQQNDDQMHKIMQKCRKKHSGSEGKSGNDYTMSNENESSEEDSESVSSLDEELFFRNSNKDSRTNRSRNGGNYGQSSNDNYGENRRSDKRKQESSGNRPSYSRNYSSMNDRGNEMSNTNDRRNNRNGMQTQNRDNGNNNNNDRRNQTECISQCFFDEMNMVDNRGFPERGSVMETMMRGVQDPSLRDFIEEAISECFYYINSDMNNREKCSFASNLISCFTDKGKERCEDWDDQ